MLAPEKRAAVMETVIRQKAEAGKLVL